MNPKKIIIIGAGVAGMSAAVKLAEKGHTVRILEARNFPGGRLYSFKDNTTGEIIDNGHHAMMGAYNNFLNLLDTLGTHSFLKSQTNTNYIFRDIDGSEDILNASGSFGKLSLLLGLLNLKRISLKSRFSAIRFLIMLRFVLKDFEELTVLELLKKHKQTDEIIRNFWEPMTLAVLNARTESAPAKLLVEALRRAFLGDKESSTMLFSSVGFSELFSTFESWLKLHNGSIDYGTSVKQIESVKGRISAIITEKEKITDFDYIISAVPPNVLWKILNDELKQEPYFMPLRDFTFSPIISIYLWVDKEITDAPFFAMLGTRTQWLFNLNKIKNRDANIKKQFPGHYALTISSADELILLTAEEIVKFAIEDLTLCLNLPEVPNVHHYRVFKDKAATIKLTPKTEKQRLKTKTPLSNLFIIGDWTDTGLPSTIEGASQSGYIIDFELN